MTKLDNAQSKAVHALQGPVLVRAGAGAGKTRVLVHRAVALLQAGVDPSNILLVTFTNKAAGEMAERLMDMAGDRAAEMFIGTLHSFAWRNIVAKLAERGGLATWNRRRGLRIASRNDLYRIQTEANASLTQTMQKERESSHLKLDDIFQFLGLIRAHGVRAGEVDEEVVREVLRIYPGPEHHEDALYKVMPRYAQTFERWAAKLNVIDFDDILVIAAQALENMPELRNELQRRYLFIQGDEFQDTNRVQLHIFDGIARRHRNLCVCGDDRQAIYGFRGADPNIMHAFMECYPEARIIELRNNYRSTPSVVATANACARAMPNAFVGEHHGMTARQRLLRSPQPLYRLFGDEKEEAQGIIEWLRARDLSQSIVLFRYRKLKEVLEAALTEAAIPYEVHNDRNFFENPEIRMAMMLSMAWTTRDGFAWSKALSDLGLGISEGAIRQHWDQGGFGALERAAARMGGQDSEEVNAFIGEGRALYEAIEQARQEPESEIGAALHESGTLDRKLNAAWHRWQKERFRRTWKTILKRYYDKRYENMAEEEKERRIADSLDRRVESATRRVGLLYRLMDRMWVSRGNMASVFEDLERFEPGQKDQQAENECPGEGILQLMTVHAAKGLEATSVVYLGGGDAAEGQDSINGEERRIFYVGVTRAKRDLLVTGACWRNNLGDHAKKRETSQFINEVRDTIQCDTKSEDNAGNYMDRLRELKAYLD